MAEIASLWKKKKGQAAFEYIHTYGWVLLAIIMLGGVMAYYYSSSPKFLLPNECVFNSGMECMGVSVEDNLLTLNMINGFGFAISNMTAEILGTCNATANTTDGNNFSNPNVMVENAQDSIVFECQDLSDVRVSEKINLTYVNVESGQWHWKMGRLEYEEGD